MKATFRRQFAVLAVLALAATGCSTAHTGHVAGRVGAQAVETSQVASYVTDLVADEKGVPLTDDLRLASERRILGFLVQHQVFTALAAKEGVTASQVEIDTTLAGLGGADTIGTSLVTNHLPRSLLPTLISSLALQNNLVDKWLPVTDAELQPAYEQLLGTLLVNVKYATVSSQAQAEQIAAKVREAPDTFNAVATQIAGPSAATAETGQQPRTQFGGDLGTQVSAAKVGDVLTANAGGQWRVLLITEHQDKTLAEARPQLLTTVRKDQIGPALSSHVSQLFATDPIVINPRFGKWDDTTLTVVDAASDTVVRGPSSGTNPLDVGGVSDGPTPTDGATPADGATPTDSPTGATDPSQGTQPSP